ncbi:MAG: cytochrome P450 [Hyphomonadaceae bacterium]|nr:cytochrome P450 [Hyphomonadaceae bacterium]
MRTLADLPEVPMIGGADLDPYAYLKDLRARTPLARGPLGMTLALRHRHLAEVIGDATRQIETETKVMQGITSGPIFDFVDTAMLFANDDAHRRRRAPITRTFAFKLMDAMRPKAGAIAADLVRARLGQGPIDFVAEIAAQVPARIIADILGIPQSDLPVFMQWIEDTAEALGFIDVARRETIEASLSAFNAYVEALLEDRRRTPRADFLSDYVAATTAGGELTEQEIRTQVVGLILAGSDTTRGSLCMTLAQLLAHPAQWAAFCADPDGLKRGVVDEGLRYEPIISAIPRVALRDLTLDGYTVPAGGIVAVSILSVLRDPDVYADPETFDIRRTDHPRWHPVFGAGAHRCAGEALARAEMEETLAAIARLAPNTALVGDFPRLAPGAIRKIDRMSVALA